MDVVSYLLGKNASGGGSGGGVEEYISTTLNRNTSTSNSAIKYMIKKIPNFECSSNVTTLLGAFSGCTILEEIGNISGTENVTDFSYACSSCNKLVKVGNINTRNATNLYQMFAFDDNLEEIPTMNFSKATNLDQFVRSCSKLSDNSLNNIMASCITATSYTRTKTLNALGLNSTQRQKCTTLSNYQAFINAGWTIG